MTRPSPFANRSAADPAGSEAKQPAKPKRPPKMSFYVSAEDQARVRGTYRNTDREEGDRSLSDFLAKAVIAEVERREKKYNSGRPFPDVEVGDVQRGRPMGE